MLLLLGFAAASGAGQLAAQAGRTPAQSLGAGLLGLTAGGLAVAAVVLAILGLIEYRAKPTAFTQGRAQAIWVLVLGGFFFLSFCAGAVRGVMGGSSFGGRAGISRPGQLLTFDELNFKFRVPDRPWVAMEAAKLNKESQLAFARQSPGATCLLIAEKLGVNSEFATHELAEAGLARMKAFSGAVRVLDQRSWGMNGLAGELRETEAQTGLQSFYYLQWYCVTNGYAYQWVGYGHASDRARLNQELQRVFAGFELLDPQRVALSGAGGFETNFISLRHPYSVQLTQSAWRPLTALEKDFPHAEFGAGLADSGFTVMAAVMGGETLDSEALVSALLSEFNVPYPSENLTHRQAIGDGGLTGLQFDFLREVEGTPMRYRFKILHGQGDAYLLAGWTRRRGTNAEAVLADALGRVKFNPQPGPSLPAEPLTERELKTQGFILNQAGLFHFRASNFERALPLFRAAARVNRHESLYAGNALQAYSQLERPQEALAFLNDLAPTLLARPEMKAWLAYFQGLSSLTEQATTNYASLFAGDYRSDTHFSEFIKLLCQQRQHDQALGAIQKYLQAEDSVAVRVLEAEIYRAKRDYSKAISLLQIQREKAPFNHQVPAALAETMLQAGQFSEAIEVSRALAKAQGDSAYNQFLKGRGELGLKWYREAKASFEAAKKLAPANAEIASYLDHVSGLLGEGSNSLLKEPISMVPWPNALTNSPPEPLPADYGKKYGAYFTRVIRAVSYAPPKPYKTTESMLVRVLDPSGVAAFSTLQFPFDPLSEEIFVNEVRVMDGSGETLSTGQIADYYVLDDHTLGQASQKKLLHIPVSGLQAGCQLAVTITRRELGRLEEFPFLQHCFSRAFPVRESHLVLNGETSGLNWRSSLPLEPRKLPEGLCWTLRDPLLARWEPLQPPASTFLPTLWINDGSARWPLLVSNYLASIGNCLSNSASVRDQALQLTASLTNDDAKIALLARHVQTNCTYKAIEFGRRARVPRLPEEIVRNKYGDCKDHALLLQQLLTAAGLPARLALVHTRHPIRTDQPSLDQFDHMIVHVPRKSGDLFLDCTDKGADLTHSLPLGLAERDALILDNLNPHLTPIPPYPLNASGLEVQRHVRVDPAGNALVEETNTLTGIYGAYLRNALLALAPANRRAVLQRQMGGQDLDLSDLSIDALELPDQPLRLRCSYPLKQLFNPANDRLDGRLRALFERCYLTADPVENRLTPFEVAIPLWLRANITIHSPAGFAPAPPLDPVANVNSRFVQAHSQLQLESGRLILRFECRQSPGKFNAGDYPAFRETMARVVTLLEPELRLKAQ